MYSNYDQNNIVVFEKKKSKRIKLIYTIAGILAVIFIGGAVGVGLSQPIVNAFGYPGHAEERRPLQLPVEDVAAEENTAAVFSEPKKVGAEYTASELYEEVKDTVVAIKLYYINPRTFEEVGSVVGSGVIFTSDGYLLTNHHVVEGANNIAVLLNDYKDESKVNEYKAELVGSDKQSDLAILKIERKEPFKAASIGDSDKLKIGQFVCPIGNPMGLSKSMTMGIVSGLNRESSYELSSIQFDAAINSGNSGGPLFDMQGNVVGIVNMKLVSLVYDNTIENISFAITINEAKPIINDLITHGEVVSRPMLGITIMPINEYTAFRVFGITGIREGLMITSVQENSPAAKNGVAAGDILTKVNGKDVIESVDVQAEIKNLKIGDKVTLTIARIDSNGRIRNHDIEVTLIGSTG
ncbi:MAG: S1C family serine protease [Eubacterium sp.]|jgi:serine protease Do|nr:S1C family serine protease [Eubacterium sp.]